MSTVVSRMNAGDRRQQVLAAATRAFARSGYAGTSTDTVAREAGVSQPYVVRMFGTKLDLFLAVFDKATDRIKGAFSEVVDSYSEERPFDPDDEEDWARLGAAYTALLGDHDFLLVMMHGFAAGSEEAIGRRGRERMSEIYTIVRRTGCTAERATEFVAHGMLLNVLLALGVPEHAGESPVLRDMAGCAFGDEGLRAAVRPS